MLAKFSETLDYVKNFMLPIFDEVKTLDDAAYFLIRYSSSAFFFKKEAFDKGIYLDSNEILLLTAISDTKVFIEKYTEYLKTYNNFMESIGYPKYDISKTIDELKEKICILESDTKYTDVANEYRNNNMKFLRERL